MRWGKVAGWKYMYLAGWRYGTDRVAHGAYEVQINLRYQMPEGDPNWLAGMNDAMLAAYGY